MAKAGNGGSGLVTYMGSRLGRSKFPAGGNGGDGGNIYLKSLDLLSSFDN